jgi:hypothetical protein
VESSTRCSAAFCSAVILGTSFDPNQLRASIPSGSGMEGSTPSWMILPTTFGCVKQVWIAARRSPGQSSGSELALPIKATSTWRHCSIVGPPRPGRSCTWMARTRWGLVVRGMPNASMNHRAERLERGKLLRLDELLDEGPIPECEGLWRACAYVELPEVAGVLGMQRAEVRGQKPVLQQLRHPRIDVHGVTWPRAERKVSRSLTPSAWSARGGAWQQKDLSGHMRKVKFRLFQ